MNIAIIEKDRVLDDLVIKLSIQFSLIKSKVFNSLSCKTSLQVDDNNSLGISHLLFNPTTLRQSFISDNQLTGFTPQAGHNFHPDTPVSYIKSLMGTLPLDPSIEEHREFIQQIQQNEAEFRQARQQRYGSSDKEREETMETMGCRNAKGLPRNFDARQKWPQCPSLGHIVDQSSCGSCWVRGFLSFFSHTRHGSSVG